MTAPHRQAGFTLVELAVAIFILALLLGSILAPLATQVEARQISETQNAMEEIRDALLGFAATNGYLPCADRQSGAGANDGTEDINAATGRCALITGGGADAVSIGNVPWVTLGLGLQDAWGNHFRYSVLETHARRTPDNLFSLGTGASSTLLRVCTSQACTTTLTRAAVAVIISHGRNGLGAINASANTANPPATAADELDNTDNDSNTVSRTQSNVAGAEFDDIVLWLSKFTLNSRMIAAGRLP